MTIDTCRLQDDKNDDEIYCVIASPFADNSVLLVAYDEPETPDDTDEIGPAMSHLTLSPDGWTTLVELYALRRPEAFQRVCDKVAALQAAQQKETA